MKKAVSPLKKKTVSRPIQPKISGFITKYSKHKEHECMNAASSSTTNSNTADEIYKRRKMSENAELSIIHCKLRRNDVMNRFNQNNTNKISADCRSTPRVIKRGIRKLNLKENVIIDLTKKEMESGYDDTEPVISNTVVAENSPIKEHELNCMKKIDKLDDKVLKESTELDIEFSYNDFSELFESDFFDSEINLNSLQKCKVTDVKRDYDSLILTVTLLESKPASCIVRCVELWKDTKVNKDDIIALEAKREHNEWLIDNMKGYIIVHPDLLISSTTIVSGLFCTRRAVLAEKFRKIESLPHYKGDQTPMIIGCLVHQLLQKAIRTEIRQLSDVTRLMDCILQSTETINMLYAADISFDTCKKEMRLFVPKIFAFIQHYVKGNDQDGISDTKENFQGKITHVHDIEDSLWLPKLGMKGKVDVTVEVNVNNRRKIVPLEIKSGKPSFSSEHRGQIILYVMMMALTGQNTDTGLLLYLRENSMQEINSRHHEKRDLVFLRNVMAGYLASKSSEASSSATSDTQWQTMDLPEPINHPKACSTCPYNALCCAYLSKDNIKLSDSHPLMKISRQILDKFKSSHIDYILQWISLLQMEESAQASEIPVARLWTLSPENREAKKTCISYLKILGKVKEYDSRYRHVLVRSNANAQVAKTEIPYMEYSENEYVLLSTSTRVNISAGFIVNITKSFVVIMLDRDVSKYKESFHVDKYSSSTLFSLNLANMGGLMGDTEVCANLRDIIIDRKPATFSDEVPTSVVCQCAKILQNLNENQQKAVLKVLTANDYILIKGMPGTGKTQTLVALIQSLHEMGNSILITSHTNNAVDNILLKLLEKRIDFLRLGTSSNHPSLQCKSEKFVTAKCNTVEYLEEAFSKNIIGVTCYGAHHPLLGKRMFDVCVVDESAQILQPTIIRPLYNAKKFVLVGDPDQLPPIVKSVRARKLGASESLFSRLDSENNTVILTEQYRMNKHIMHLANKLTYNDALKAGNELVENSTFSARNVKVLMNQRRWVQRVLSQNIINSVIVVNTGSTNALKVSQEVSNKYPESDQIYSNIWEAALALKIVQTLLEMGVTPSNIGIIAPYKAHVILLKKVIQKNVEINTVDQYQGRDKEIIIFSCARSLIRNINVKEDLEVLGDQRRLTVAITRAKSKLIVIGDKCSLLHYSAFKTLFELIQDKNIIDLTDQREDFSWESIICTL